MKPYETFQFRDYPFRWIAVWICWNMGTVLEKMGALKSKDSAKYK